MREKAYSVLSTIYDRLIDKDLYEQWKDRSLKVLKSYPDLKTGADVACGSGFFTIAQRKAGYKVVGVDVCKEMLFKAQLNALKEGLDINFIEQDAVRLKLFEKVDYITVINDGLNYIADQDLLKTFKNFYGSLNPFGVLYFDFSTKYRLKNVIGNNVFAEDYDDLTFLWFNELNGDKINMDMTVFYKNGANYVRRDESHVQFMHDLCFIESSLKAAGFSTVTARDFSGGDISPTTERIEIIAVKSGK